MGIAAEKQRVEKKILIRKEADKKLSNGTIFSVKNIVQPHDVIFVSVRLWEDAPAQCMTQ